MTFKHGDSHPTKPGWRFICYRELKSGELAPKWCSPAAWQAKKDSEPARHKNYYEKHKELVKAKSRDYRDANLEVCRAKSRTYYRSHKPKHYWLSKRMESKKLGLPFDLPESLFHNIPAKCPVLGIPLFYTDNARTDNTPSLDRVIPEMGYVLGNVNWISLRANRLKSDASLKDIEAIRTYIKKHVHKRGQQKTPYLRKR